MIVDTALPVRDQVRRLAIVTETTTARTDHRFQAVAEEMKRIRADNERAWEAVFRLQQQVMWLGIALLLLIAIVLAVASQVDWN